MGPVEKKVWIRSGIFTLLQRGSVLVIGFGTVYFLARMLEKDVFGSWVLFLTITTILEIGKQGLIQNGTIKFLASENKSNYAQIVKASFILNTLITTLLSALVVVVSYGLLHFYGEGEIRQLLLFYAIVMLAQLPLSHFEIIQQANFYFEGIFYSYLMRQGGLFLYVAVFYFLNSDVLLVHLVWVQIGTTAIAAVVAYFFTKPYLPQLASLSWVWVKKLFSFGRFSMATNLSSVLYKSVDHIMIALLLSNASVAVYNIAGRVTNLVEYPTTAIASLIFPQSARRANLDGERAVKNLYEKSVGLTLAIILPGMAVVLLIPKFIILLIAGDNYLDAVPILQLTILYGLFLPFSRQFGVILEATNRPNINFYFVFAGMLVNILSNFIFIYYFGLKGAVYGTLFSYAVMFIVTQRFLYTHFNVRLLHTLHCMVGFYKQGFVYGLNYLKAKNSA
ncbi:flippase [Tunicatimonas pelagia]|uniref:flippase n=1 Tax=Tunicatimonas pelagia TaxID=931531 RepID=UPI002666ECD4|nr:flippase [Tunicatimonas pelagia]WKN42332.1 flippase [Tunicatimonas pelagia]